MHFSSFRHLDHNFKILSNEISSSSGSSRKEQLPEDRSMEEDEDNNGTDMVNDVEN
jgi:hypothetical protein